MTPGRAARPPARALSGFGVVLVVQVVGGLVQTTGLLATLGPRGWAAVSVGQTAGLLGATVVSGGLMSFGASVVATTEADLRAEGLLTTLRARAVLYTAMVVPLVAVASVISPDAAPATALVAAASLLPALAASWYFVGGREPGRWLRCEVLPVNAGAVLGILVTLLVPSVTAFALCFVGGAATAVVLSLRAVRRDLPPGGLPGQQTPKAFLIGHRRFFAAGVAAGVNGQGPALLMAASGVGPVPTYLLLDRLVRYVVAGAAPLVQFAQGWVPAGGEAELPVRARRTLVRFTALAAGAALAFACVVDVVARLLAHGSITVPPTERVLFAALVGVLVLTQVNALAVLVPLGLDRILAVSTVAGAVALLVAGGIAAASGGLRQVLLTTLVVEAAILLVQLVAVVRRLRRV